MKHEFKVGDRVRVTKIDDSWYYGDATYEVGDIGTVCQIAANYLVQFDRLKQERKRSKWWVLTNWLEPEIPQVMKCE